MLLGKPLFPGKNVVHQLDLMTDFLGTPPPESISRVSHSTSLQKTCSYLRVSSFSVMRFFGILKFNRLEMKRRGGTLAA